MFAKETWTLLKLKQEEGEPFPFEAFKAAFEGLGTKHIPLVAISQAIHEQTQTVGIAPFSTPRLGDEEDIEFYFNKAEKEFKVEDLGSFLVNYNDLFEWEMNDAKTELVKGTLSVPLAPFWKSNLDEWKFTEGVYGMWFMDFEYIDALDSASKKEQLAYGYGAPFKLQSGEIKKQIQDQIVDANTFTRKHYQIVLDFNLGYIWVNTGSKPTIMSACALFDELGLKVDTPTDLLGDTNADAISSVLNGLYESSTINEAMVRRLNEMKLHGPKGIEPDPDAVQEKILKAFCAFSEAQGFHLGMSTPLALYLSPGFVTTTGAKTSFEVTELFGTHEEATIAEAGLTFCYLIDKVSKTGEAHRILDKQFSITATSNFFFTGETSPPGLIIKGLNIENFKHITKVHTTATGNAPTIAEFWQMYYDAMKVSVFTYFSILKDLVEQA